ncbi:hypothetical protein ACIBCN_01475 [Nocardia sp. NPDC051052]|uniref:hypothetical protein n=1 Tax=Nocardia sp. NPDC051052 TaxID=3364322 RepID=UPI0037BC6EAF
MEIPVPILRRDAVLAGFTDDELRGAGWRRVHRGLYVESADAVGLTVEQRHHVLTRAVVAAATSAVTVTHVSAAIVHGLPVWRIPLARVHLSRNRRTGGRVRRRSVLHSMPIAIDEWVMVDDLPVTTVARTVVDLARTVPFEQAVVVGDAALRLGTTTRDELCEQVERAKGRTGRPQASRVVEFLDGRAESPGESRSRVAMRELKVPSPELQARILTPTKSVVARVDFLFPDLGVIGEFDGEIKYRSELRGTLNPEDVVIAEKNREDALRRLGWTVVRWTWRDLDTPHTWLPHLAAEIARNTPTLGTYLPTPRT